MKSVIEVRNLSKSYVISHQQKAAYNSVKDSLGNLLQRPFKGPANFTKETFWALEDVTFDVKQGEIFGVLGKNGSGKSTLLKILSRIVDPTKGEVKMKGRVASLLEVGTGFHPELTGRENIYLNGSMLGLSRQEISRRFDEIVDFSEVSKFLDTPVKFYSSGMYVRLAFSVAAHLEPDILILDEVLSVGDAAFQKKSLSKIVKTMQSGCTVLMVSHSAETIHNMCNRALYLEDGHIKSLGKVDKVLIDYKKSQIAQIDPRVTLLREVIPHYTKVKSTEPLNPDSSLEVEIKFTVTKAIENCFVNYLVEDSAGKYALHTRTDFTGKNPSFSKGEHVVKVRIPRLSLNTGTYSTWFRFVVQRDVGDYALDTERKEFEVKGRPEDNLSTADIPALWDIK